MGIFRKTFNDKTKYDYIKRTKERNFTFLSHNFCKEGQTVFAGDSITELFNIDDLFWDYTERTGLHIYNRGISGDTSNRLLERFYENVLIIKPKNIVMLVGTNDLACGATPEEITDNIGKIVRLSKEYCPGVRIILQSVYPVKNAGKRKNGDILKINEILKELCRREDAVYADVHSRLKDKNGEFSDEFSYDGLHPNAVGFAAASKVIMPLLEQDEN